MQQITEKNSCDLRGLFLSMLFVMALGPTSVYALAPTNAVSVDLLLPALSPVSKLAGEESSFIPLNIKYQRVLTEHQVLMFKMGLNYNWGHAGDSSVDIYPMLALEWHPYQTGLQGFYLGPSLFFNYSTYSYSGASTALDMNTSYWLAVGGNIGYEFVLPSNTVVDLSFGLGYGYSYEKDMSGKTTSGFRMDETMAGVFFGYSF